jgi:hypothetical protein
MKSTLLKIAMLSMITLPLMRCSDQSFNGPSSNDLNGQLVDVAQTSGQLASGTSFNITGSSADSLHQNGPPHHGGGGRAHRGILDGVNLLAPTDEILAIVDAESASDFRGMRISKNGGATVTNYDASGNVVSLPTPTTGAPNGCSFSGKQFPQSDSLLSKIAKTVIDFGNGMTWKRDTISITRAGKITITRSGNTSNLTEVTTFENYSVNRIKIEGTKTRVSTYDATSHSASSTTSVSNGKITLADGTVTTWTSDKTRTNQITISESTGRPISGTIVTEVKSRVVSSNGDVIYAHETTTPLTENLACAGRRAGPVSGVLETIYRENTIEVNFGDGSCENRTITLTVNGVTTTKTIGD